MKECRVCGLEKPLTEFHRTKSNKDGHDTRCKSCRKTGSAQEYRDKWFEATAKLKKSYCKVQGIPFDLTAEYLESIWTDRCPVFDVPFVRFDKRSDRSPALDRIEPDKGYVQGNVRFISARANRIKYDATVEELLKVVEYMEGATTIPKGSTPQRAEAPSPS